MPNTDIQSKDVIQIRRQLLTALGIIAVLVFLAVFVFPMSAYAGEGTKGVNFKSILESLQVITSVVLLPIGIIIAGWRIAYLGIFCAMAGIDPLGMLNSSDGSVSTSEAVSEIKQHLSGFVKGLCWVGGIWIVFQIALTIAQMLAASIAGVTS